MRKHLSAHLWLERLEPRDVPSTFYVATTGADGAAGSATAPWRTLQYAAGHVSAGDTVIVRAGNYTGFNVTTSGTAAAPINFHADAGVTINTPNPWNSNDGINLEGASYVIIEGFTVIGMPRAGIRAVTDNHVTIRGNVCDQNNTWGIFTGFSDDLTIQGNIASRSATQHGIYVSNSGDRPVIRGNTVWGNAGSGIQLNADLGAGGDGIISSALVEGNTIYDNGRLGGSGINCDGVQNARIQNNLLYNNHASGISLFRIDGGGPSTGDVVVNNTVLMASDARWALNIQNASTGDTAINNILYDLNISHGSIDISADSLPGFTSDNNVVMNNFSTSGSILSLASWRALGRDVHSIVAVPADLFVNPAGNDYHLRPGSPAIDQGTASNAPSTDLDGNPRPSGAGFDIGAYEYQVSNLARASFAGSDVSTQGSWTARYGADGYDIIGAAAALPAYAQLSPTGQSSHTWAGSTADVRALQKPGSSDRIAACWYASGSFGVDVNLTDGQAHNVTLYLLDWDSTARAERVEVLDASTGIVLDSRDVSGFNGGLYLSYSVTGHVIFRFTQQAGANAVLSGLFFGDQAPPTLSVGASFTGSDAATQGSWTGQYGAGGYDVITAAAALPAYAQLSPTGQSSHTWAGSTADVRALQVPGTSNRVAACWYAFGSFNVDVNLSDGQAHKVTLYLLDWDSTARAERVDVLDAATGTVLDSRNASNFNGGLYLSYSVTGHVVFRFTQLAGANAVLSGLFFGSAGSSPSTSASLTGTDSATQGSWVGQYGADGSDVIGAAAALPAYAQVSPVGQSSHTWAGSTVDVRALQKPGSSDRIAACWYASGSFSVDANLTDGQAHKVTLYLLDWDSTARAERVEVLDAATGTVLDSRDVSGFNGGLYLSYSVTGHVIFRFTQLAGANAVLSGLFFG
jgi:parallel beta-helix repeat protein